MKTLSPEAFSSAPMEADAMPLPNELQTPPVTKMYFGKVLCLKDLILKEFRRSVGAMQ